MVEALRELAECQMRKFFSEAVLRIMKLRTGKIG